MKALDRRGEDDAAEARGHAEDIPWVGVSIWARARVRVRVRVRARRGHAEDIPWVRDRARARARVRAKVRVGARVIWLEIELGAAMQKMYHLIGACPTRGAHVSTRLSIAEHAQPENLAYLLPCPRCEPSVAYPTPTPTPTPTTTPAPNPRCHTSDAAEVMPAST